MLQEVVVARILGREGCPLRAGLDELSRHEQTFVRQSPQHSSIVDPAQYLISGGVDGAEDAAAALEDVTRGVAERGSQAFTAGSNRAHDGRTLSDLVD